jgi:hypothetical protein
MSNELFYQEIREANRAVREIEAADKAKAEAGTKLLVDAVDKIINLASMARKEGLLALEELVDAIDEDSEFKYLKQMILMVVDGDEPELVEQTGMMVYYADDLRGYEALQYYALLFGMLSIQQGMNPRIIEQSLLSMMPKSVKKAYEKDREERQNARWAAEKAIDKANGKELIEKVCAEKSKVERGNEAYYLTRLLDYLIMEGLDDRALQRVLRDIYDKDLVYILKALSGEARRKIFRNLSEWHAEHVANELDLSKLVLLKYVIIAENDMLALIMKLYGTAEIRLKDGEVTEAFARVITIPYEKQEQDVDLKMATRDLEKLVGEYMSEDKKMI